MTLSLDVYDVTNTAPKIGSLSKAHKIGWFSDLRVPGRLQFTVDVDASADRALLADQRVVRVNVDGTDIEAFIVQNAPSELAVEDERPFVTYDCRHLLTWLGYEEGGAVLHPYGSLDGRQQSPRWFGPMSFDFPDITRPEPTTGGTLTRAGWPDPNAYRFVFNERAVYRRLLTGNPDAEGPARMWFTTASWTEARVWFDGAELTALSTPAGETSIRTFDIPYDGEDHVICIIAHGEPPDGLQNSLGWTWARLGLGHDGEWNQLGDRLFTTYNTATYEGPGTPTEPDWQAWEDYETFPGVTVGFIAGTAVDEAQTRGLLGTMTHTRDDDNDADDTPWEREIAKAFRIQKIGNLLDSLAPFGCEPQMTPTGELKLHQARGTDRTATVTVTTPFSLSATAEGPKATRYLYETEGGFGQAINEAAETALGVKLEDVAQLGEDINSDTAAEAIAARLTLDAAGFNGIAVDLPDDVVPNSTVFIGDTVLCRSDADGTISDVRLATFICEVDDETRRLQWSAVAEPA